MTAMPTGVQTAFTVDGVHAVFTITIATLRSPIIFIHTDIVAPCPVSQANLSGKGKSILSQASKTPNSQVSSSQSSSAFELLASEEVTSQVITHQEEVVKQSQASQQEVGEDLALWDIVPTEEVLDNEVNAVEDFTEVVETDVNTPESDSAEF